MTIVFDLDYTIYDTITIKSDIIRTLVDFGYASEVVEQTFSDARGVTPGGVGYYIPEKHAALLTSQRTDLASEERVASLIHGCAEQGERLLYPGVIELLTHLRTQGHHLTLLTLGDDRWQRAKVVGAGLDRLCDRIVTTILDKENVIRDLKGEDPRVVVVNDNVPETRRMRAAVPEFYYIIKRGPKGVPDDCDFPIAETMADVERFILA